ERQLELHCELGTDKLLVRRVTGHEFLGRLFEYQLTCYSLDADVRLEALLGTHASVRVRTAQSERFFDGMVVSCSSAGTRGRYALYQLTLKPWLWVLAQEQNCRVFQRQTTLDIVKEVLAPHGLGPVSSSLSGSYKAREYCIQYRETELSFISRLLEDEGIYYYFKHGLKQHEWVLADDPATHVPAQGFERLHFVRLDDVGKVPGTVWDWSTTKQIEPGQVVLLDYDFEKPPADLRATGVSLTRHAHSNGEYFDYPGGYTDVTGAGEGEQRAKLRIQERVAKHEVFEAYTDALGLAPGNLVELMDHPRRDQNRRYLVVGMRYEIDSGSFDSDGGGAAALVYRARTTLIDAKVQFRPARITRVPVIASAQTATVVGPDNQEVEADEYGRVRVHFHWDRAGKGKPDSSCFVRVAQAWAGARYGAFFIPRIGQEVVVEFLEGDPDRPIITGCVYNANNKPPWNHPEQLSQSGWKTRSTKRANPDSYNELRFEDAKGKEEIHIQAERDLTSKVKHDSAHEIKNKLTVNVLDSDYRTKVSKGNMLTEVKQLFEVQAGELLLKVGGSTIHMQSGSITIEIGGSKIDLTAALMQLEGRTIKLN
ncbi:MAG TPA: type VI secretion system tip protein TssI/VgrG, partial [Polyangiales bacterium]|nr:type VI secretion system tip protein TssI/VgrG [Polyangiales bacterium]